MKLALIVGARPQFIKAAPLLCELETIADTDVVLIHSGQHFDANMSDIFFCELGLRQPEYHLGINSSSHGEMTGRMLGSIEQCLMRAKVERVVVFGDTNTTLAGALAAAKLGVPVAHVEAGLRSWNRAMPEEVNRVLVDHCSTWLFCPTDQAVQNLAREGISRGVHLVGDIMFDAVRMFGEQARERVAILESYRLRPEHYSVLTIHRAYNTQDTRALRSILDACGRLDTPVLFPVHPRTRPLISAGVDLPSNVILCDPLGYLDMLCVVANACMVLTDSGGLQKEAYFLRVPCVTLRPETEWVETVTAGWNIVAGTDADRIVASVNAILSAPRTSISCFGDGHAARQMCADITADMAPTQLSSRAISGVE